MSFSIGGGGNSSVSASTDVALSNPANNEVLTYDGGLDKWKNAAAGGGAVTSVAGRTGAVVLAAEDIASGTLAIGRIPTGATGSTVSLGDHTHDNRYYTEGEVDTALSGKANTSHTHAQADITNLTTDLAAKAPLASPTFTGTVTAPLLKLTSGSPGAGKVLTSDADGDASWQTPASGVTDHTLLSNIGTNSHAQIDTAISNSASHIANTSNPHGVTKAQVGLANVDNTSDANKPVSLAVQTALDGKADTGDVPSLLVLDNGDPIPGGTPSGTIIFYRAA